MGPYDPQPNWHIGMRGTQHRAVMWRVWKEGGTGFLYWGANCYEKAMIPSAEVCFATGKTLYNELSLVHEGHEHKDFFSVKIARKVLFLGTL
jgi:hypothetical protein